MLVHSAMVVETLLHSSNVDLRTVLCSVVGSLVVETQKSFLCLLLVIGCQSDDRNALASLTLVNHKSPFDELTKIKEPVEETKDAGENDDTESEDDDGEEEQDDESGDEGSDYEEEEDSDDDAEANGDSDSDEDDDDNDGNEDDDDDDNDEDEDDDDEDEEEEQKEPPSKKKK